MGSQGVVGSLGQGVLGSVGEGPVSGGDVGVGSRCGGIWGLG